DSLIRITKPRTLEDLFQQRESGQLPELNLIVRADVQGSIDALLKTLGDLPSDQVKLNILHSGIGSISESDVVLAEASNAGVIGRSHYVRVIRDGKIIVPTTDDVKKGRNRGIGSLRRFKDDVKEVRAGFDCGIRVEDFDDVKPGDILESYEVTEHARTL